MKRFWKIIFITLGILAGVGLASLLLGSLFGGVAQAFTLIGQEAREKGAGYILPGKDGSWDEMWYRLESEMEQSGRQVIREQSYKELDAADRTEVKNILIEAGRCELIIKTTERDTYGISAVDIHALQYYVEEGTLVIRAGYNSKEDGKDGSLTLYLPETATVNKMELELGAGILSAEDLKTGYFSLETGAGGISIRGLQAEEVEIEAGLGQAEIRDSEVTDLVIEVGMGGFSYQGTIRGDVEAECGMGMIQLTVAGKKDDFNYETECAAGSIIIDETDDALGMGEHVFDNGAEKEMELNCAMGTIKIEFYENGGTEYER